MTGRHLALVAACTGVCAALGHSDPAWGSATYHLSYDDEFNSLQLASGPGTSGYLPRDYWNNGYLPSNGEQQWYANPATDGYNPFSVANGILTITARPTPSGVTAGDQPYVSGELSTASGAPYPQNPQGKGFNQKYGYFEIRCQLPAGQGLWPAFWMVPANGSWPPEYDVFEVLGNDPGTVYQTAHWTDANGQHKAQGSSYQGVNSATGFHTYGFLWDSSTIKWYVDGQLTQTQANICNVPMYMIVNLAVGGYWPGNPDATTPFPAAMSVDYLRVYSADPAVAAVTPQSGYSIDANTLPVAVPEPAHLSLLALGAFSLCARRRCRSKASILQKHEHIRSSSQKEHSHAGSNGSYNAISEAHSVHAG